MAVTAETGAARGDAAALRGARGRLDEDRAAAADARADRRSSSVRCSATSRTSGRSADGVHRVSAGSPRACMDLAKHLIDKGVISYESGGWTLPARLDPSDLPGTAEDAIRDRIAALQPFARWLAEAQALADDQFCREDYRLLRPDAEPGRIDRAISELVSNQVLVGDGRHVLAGAPGLGVGA